MSKNEYYYHWFYNRDLDFWKRMGFEVVERYSSNSIIIKYVKGVD